MTRADLPQPTTAAGRVGLAALLAEPGAALLGLDFDGTLAPIVDDPAQAHIHPDAGDVLVDLAGQVLAVAVVTGRPARQALDLGGLERVGNAIGDAGKELYLFGQYGNERWSSTNRRVIGPRPPHGLATFIADLPRLLRRLGIEDAHVEEKGLAVAVHTRRLDDPAAAYDELLPAIREQAARHDLVVEPGKQVIEVRSAGMHKGVVVDRLVGELDAGGFVFIGDDLGDVEAFEAVRALTKNGLATLLVCSADSEESALHPLSDVLVHGPEGVLDLLRQLTADAAALRA
jgi:trehalose 6-phosphate phosphatase